MAPFTAPSITLEDLAAFHLRTYGTPAPPKSLESLRYHETDGDDPSNEIHEEDDGLGYYEDGVKRTLTDEQIAMFRHSEIYALIRERQVCKENLEAEEGLSSEGEVEDANAAESRSITVPEQGYQPVLIAPSLETTTIVSDRTETLDAANERTSAADTTSDTVKRKRMDDDSYDSVNRERRARARVRELDYVNQEDQNLDYGDGTVASSVADPMAKVDEKGPSKPNNVAEHASKPNEGRKIWWPILEPDG